MKVEVLYLRVYHLRRDEWKPVRTLTIECDHAETIASFKQKIQAAAEDLPVERQRLSIRGSSSCLEDTKTLAWYHIDKHKTVFLRLR